MFDHSRPPSAFGHVAPDQPGGDRLGSKLPGGLRRELAAGALERDLERLELIDDVAPGALAERLQLRRQGEVHARIVTRPHPRRRSPSRAVGRGASP